MKLHRRRGAGSGSSVGRLDPIAVGPPIAVLEAATDLDDAVTTPFEDWCQAVGTHPEALGAWEAFTQQARPS